MPFKASPWKLGKRRNAIEYSQGRHFVNVEIDVKVVGKEGDGCQRKEEGPKTPLKLQQTAHVMRGILGFSTSSPVLDLNHFEHFLLATQPASLQEADSNFRMLQPVHNSSSAVVPFLNVIAMHSNFKPCKT